MKLTVIASCKGGPCPCPAVYRTDDGRYVVQGRRVKPNECEGLTDLSSDEQLVEIPADLTAALTDYFGKKK